jgi:hypothetical protein
MKLKENEFRMDFSRRLLEEFLEQSKKDPLFLMFLKLAKSRLKFRLEDLEGNVIPVPSKHLKLVILNVTDEEREDEES